MRLYYLYKTSCSCFRENFNAGKAKLQKFYLTLILPIEKDATI